MNVGIILYSQTGNTRSVAGRLRDSLSAAGHSASLEEVKVAGGRTGRAKDFALEALPEPARYDVLVLGSPVEAFSLSPVMRAYLTHVTSLEKKKVALLVTEGFPYPWLGGTRAVHLMRRLCEAKGATVLGSGIVPWMGSGREDRIQAVVTRLTKLVAGL
jgi:hypothetical protein